MDLNSVSVKQETMENNFAASSCANEVDKVADQLGNVNIGATTSSAAQLHEFLSKRQLKWEYVDINGSVNSKLFEVELRFAGLKFRGTGSQKKLARQSAALNACEEITKTPSLLPGKNETEKGNSPSAKSSVNGDSMDNPISKLNELCAKNKIPLPDFALIHEYTPPDFPFFKISCAIKLLNVVTEGGGSTKKAAKSSAAHAALIEIESKGIFTESPKKAKPKLMERQSSDAITLMKMKFLEELEGIPFEESIFKSLRDDNFDCNSYLMRIANQKIDYLEIDLTEINTNEYRCVCQLYIDEHKEIPIFTTWGKSSCSMEEAKKLASRRAMFLILSSRSKVDNIE